MISKITLRNNKWILKNVSAAQCIAERGNLVVNSHIDRRPIQTMKERGDMIKFGTREDKLIRMALNFLEFFNDE